MGINTNNYNIYPPLYNNSILPNQVPANFGAGQLPQDIFMKTNSNKSPEMVEFERLFPNGELYNIFNDIVKEFGIECPPQLEFVNEKDSDYAYAMHMTNKLNLNVANLSTKNMYKVLLEKNGSKYYDYDDTAKNIRILITDDKELMNGITEYYKKKEGVDNCTFVPLTDDDKRKLIIKSLAHELEHFYQNQIIRHTEGLDEFEMMEKRLKNRSDYKPSPNYIDEKLKFLKLKKAYMDSHKSFDMEKRYSQSSPEGKKALEWYNATVNYIDYKKDYDNYLLNSIESDANERAHQYLTTHYGDFAKA
ncbi:hypothetical protein IJ596_08885 [bacterium]|nr:hypothetical protein [bacterium]